MEGYFNFRFSGHKLHGTTGRSREGGRGAAQVSGLPEDSVDEAGVPALSSPGGVKTEPSVTPSLHIPGRRTQHVDRTSPSHWSSLRAPRGKEGPPLAKDP